MMNPNKLTKLNLVLLCSMIAYPAYAMEDGGQCEAGEAAAPCECTVQPQAAPYQVVRREEIDSDWICPICQIEEEDDCDSGEIIRLRNCGHIFHHDCMKANLIQGASAARFCPICRQPHEMRRNIMAMHRQLLPDLSDKSQFEGVPEQFVADYERFQLEYVDALEAALDKLSDDQVRRFYEVWKARGLSNSQVLFPFFQQLDEMIDKLWAKKESGEQITKEMIRASFDFSLLISLDSLDSPDGPSQISSWLQEQGENELAQRFIITTEDFRRFMDEHQDLVLRLRQEIRVNKLHAVFSCDSLEAAAAMVQPQLDQREAINHEIGLRDEDLTEMAAPYLEQQRAEREQFEQRLAEQLEQISRLAEALSQFNAAFQPAVDAMGEAFSGLAQACEVQPDIPQEGIGQRIWNRMRRYIVPVGVGAVAVGMAGIVYWMMNNR